MRYEVAVKEVYKTIITVEAFSEADAKHKAKQILLSSQKLRLSEDAPDGIYDYTLDQEEWQVREE